MSRFQFPEKAKLCELREKRLIRDLQPGTKSTVKREFYRTTQVTQSSVNPHITDIIVGHRIVCSIFQS